MQEELLKQQGLALAMAVNPEHIREIGRAFEFFNNKIESLVFFNDKIESLAIAFNVFTRALRNFSDLTTSSRFGRMWDSIIGEEDNTVKIIKVLNNFASDVKSEELLKAAQATQSFNNAMRGYAQPIAVQRTNIENSTVEQINKSAEQVNRAQSSSMPNQQDAILARIEKLLASSNSYLSRIRDHTDPDSNI
jgi:hypothetical protein